MGYIRSLNRVVHTSVRRRARVAGVICAALLGFSVANPVQAQLLLSDNFDVGNTNGGAPNGWTLTVVSGTQVSVVNSTVTAAASAPFCVRLTDNSASSRPQMFQNFRAEPSGRACASYKINTVGTAPGYLQMYTSSGTFLCALVLDSNGLIGYDNTGTGTIDTTISWTTGSWQKVEVEWFGDGTFNGYLGTTQFVQRATFATNTNPSRVTIIAGTTSGSSRITFVDDVQVVETEALMSDDFDTGNTFNSNPVGWTVTEPSGTNIRIVNSTVRAPQSSPFCVEFSDNSSAGDPEMYTNFNAASEGRVFYSALVPSTNQAPFYMHLRDANGIFLTAISLGSDGKMAYNNTVGGSGPFTESSIFWVTNTWQTVRVDWFTNGTFSAYLGSNPIVANVPFGTNSAPGRVLFRLADTASSNRLAYLDDVLVSRAVYPGTATYTNNAMWLGYAYLSTQSYWLSVPQVAYQMRTNYCVPYWFLNVGTLDNTGRLTGSTPTATVTNFLNTLKTWENQQGYQFKVLAWLNADSSVVDVTSPSVRSNIVDECKKLVSTSWLNSYVAGASRTFDGMQLDLEPAGLNTNLFNGLVTLFDQVRAGFGSIGMSSKLTSFTAPKYGTANSSYWSADNYYAMASHLDLLVAMTYDSGLTTGAAYQSWIQDQATNVLRAVSGKNWNNDALHPAPTNGVKVLIGFPAFPNSSFHTNTAENIFYAAPGVNAGLSNLQTIADFSTNYFQGAAVFLLSDGTPAAMVMRATTPTGSGSGCNGSITGTISPSRR